MTQLPNNYEPLSLTFREPREVNGRIVFGDDYGTELCLIDGAVWSIDPTGILPRRFVNSTIDQLAMSIEVHRQACQEAERARSVVDGMLAVETLASSLNCVDTMALADEENWWSVVVEQIRDGLM